MIKGVAGIESSKLCEPLQMALNKITNNVLTFFKIECEKSSY